MKKYRWIRKTTVITVIVLALLLLLLTAPGAEENGEDTVFFKTDFTSFVFSPSSGSSDRWNKQSGVSAAGGVDPEDAGNRIAVHTLTSNSGFVQKSRNETENPFVLEMSLRVISGDSALSKLTVRIGAADLLVLTAEGNHYTVTLLGTARGTVEADAWMRLTVVGVPGASGCTMSATLDAANGVLQTDSDSTQLVSVAAGYTLPASADFRITGEGAIGAAYCMDDLAIYSPGDFSSEGLMLSYYADQVPNVRLDGPFVLPFNHALSVTGFDPEQLTLENPAGEAVPFSVVLDPIHPSRLTFTFPTPLDEYTDYTLRVVLADVTGQTLTESFCFTTRGAEGAVPARFTLSEAPEGGYIMPDRYNTGFVSDFEELVPFTEKYPEVYAQGGSINIYDKDVERYGNVFEGYTVDGYMINVYATSPVTLRDFYHDAKSCLYGIYNRSCSYLTVSDGECLGSTAAFGIGSHTAFIRIYCHDVHADHLKGSSDMLFLSCYIRDGGTRTPGAHADVLQISGNANAYVNNIKVLGCRFDIPALCYDHVANACIFLKSENGTVGVSNLQIDGNWFNGGGYTTYLTTGYVGKEHMLNIVYTNNRIGYGHQFGPINKAEFLPEELTYEGNGYVNGLAAGSIVFTDENGKRLTSFTGESGITAAALVANYTTLAQGYRLVLTYRAADGSLLGEKTENGTVRRYTPTKEYITDANTEKVVVKDSGGKDVEVTRLITLPDLPHDELLDIAWTDFEGAGEGATLTLALYDSAGTLLRSGAIGYIEPEPEPEPDPITLLGISVLPGAEMRVTENAESSGLRFTTVLPAGLYGKLVAVYGDENVSVTTLLVPTDRLSAAADFTAEALDAAGVQYLRYSYQAFRSDSQGELCTAVWQNILPEEYACAFSVRSFISVVTPDGTVSLASIYSEEHHSRSVDAVATAAYTDRTASPDAAHPHLTDDGYSPFTDAERSLLAAYLTQVMRLTESAPLCLYEHCSERVDTVLYRRFL